MNNFHLIHESNKTKNRVNNYLILKRKDFNFLDSERIKYDLSSYVPILKALLRWNKKILFYTKHIRNSFVYNFAKETRNFSVVGKWIPGMFSNPFNVRKSYIKFLSVNYNLYYGLLNNQYLSVDKPAAVSFLDTSLDNDVYNDLKQHNLVSSGASFNYSTKLNYFIPIGFSSFLLVLYKFLNYLKLVKFVGYFSGKDKRVFLWDLKHNYRLPYIFWYRNNFIKYKKLLPVIRRLRGFERTRQRKLFFRFVLKNYLIKQNYRLFTKIFVPKRRLLYLSTKLHNAVTDLRKKPYTLWRKWTFYKVPRTYHWALPKGKNFRTPPFYLLKKKLIISTLGNKKNLFLKKFKLAKLNGYYKSFFLHLFNNSNEHLQGALFSRWFKQYEAGYTCWKTNSSRITTKKKRFSEKLRFKYSAKRQGYSEKAGYTYWYGQTLGYIPNWRKNRRTFEKSIRRFEQYFEKEIFEVEVPGYSFKQAARNEASKNWKLRKWTLSKGDIKQKSYITQFKKRELFFKTFWKSSWYPHSSVWGKVSKCFFEKAFRDWYWSTKKIEYQYKKQSWFEHTYRYYWNKFFKRKKSVFFKNFCKKCSIYLQTQHKKRKGWLFHWNKKRFSSVAEKTRFFNAQERYARPFSKKKPVFYEKSGKRYWARSAYQTLTTRKFKKKIKKQNLQMISLSSNVTSPSFFKKGKYFSFKRELASQKEKPSLATAFGSSTITCAGYIDSEKLRTKIQRNKKIKEKKKRSHFSMIPKFKLQGYSKGLSINAKSKGKSKVTILSYEKKMNISRTLRR